MDTEDAAGALYDAGVSWLVGSTSSDVVIRAACDVLAAGADGANLRLLAAISVNEHVSRWEFDPLLARAVAEVGRQLPSDPDLAQLAATRAMAGQMLGGQMTCRELVSWAHDTIGHDGADAVQPLVNLADEYDHIDAGFGWRAVNDVDVAVRAAARRLTHVPE